MIFIREIGDKIGVFKSTPIELIGIVEKGDDLLLKLIQKEFPSDIKIPDTKENKDYFRLNTETCCIYGKKSESPANSVKVIDTPQLYMSLDGVNVFVQSDGKSVEVGESHSQDLRHNIMYALELLLDEVTETECSQFPAVGKPYWYVTTPSPLNVVVNQGVIDSELMREISESDCLGNMFRTKQEAEEAAKKVARLFENF